MSKETRELLTGVLTLGFILVAAVSFVIILLTPVIWMFHKWFQYWGIAT